MTDADALVIGAPKADPAGADSGAVYVFQRSGSAWKQAQKLTAGAADLTACAARDLHVWAGVIAAVVVAGI